MDYELALFRGVAQTAFQRGEQAFFAALHQYQNQH